MTITIATKPIQSIDVVGGVSVDRMKKIGGEGGV